MINKAKEFLKNKFNFDWLPEIVLADGADSI